MLQRLQPSSAPDLPTSSEKRGASAPRFFVAHLLPPAISVLDVEGELHETGNQADVAKLVDAADLKSADLRSYGFDPRRPHHFTIVSCYVS